MSKYNNLWDYVSRCSENKIELDFSKVEEICGFPIDHSFLNCKKELAEYGWQVGKISMKNKKIEFIKDVSINDNCPCKRKCERHGECNECRDYHENSKYPTACKKKI